MNYRIQTIPIWDTYKAGGGCPLCRLIDAKEKKLVKSYLNENVMDPDYRERSNAVGFCPEHIRMLYAGENKLGLALQNETRAAYLIEMLNKAPGDKKSAVKFAERLREHTGCVICAELSEFMPRYYQTVAQMYDNEPEFPALFSAASHCLKHATELYAACEYAGRSVKNYLRALNDGLYRDLKKAETDLRRFADCFDHASTARPDPKALPDAIATLITQKIN